MSRALPPPPSHNKPTPSTHSGAWLKPTYGLQNGGFRVFSFLFPRHARGLGSKANLGVVRPDETIPYEYDAPPAATTMLGWKGRQT
jgi:hypothetical protein